MSTISMTKSNAKIILPANSIYAVYGSDDTVTLAADDLLGLFGSGDHVSAASAGDSIWLGQNGQLAGGAAIDTAAFANGGALYEMGGSNVSLTGSHVNVTVNDWDTLTAIGSAIHFIASGPGEIVNLGGDGVYASNADEDLGSFATGGALNLFANTRADVTGNQVVATLVGNDTLGLYGSGDSVTSTTGTDFVWIGRNGNTASGANIDSVTLTLGGTVYEMGNSNLDVIGSNIAITMTSNDTLTLLPITNTNYSNGYNDAITAIGTGDIVNVNASGQSLGPAGTTVNFQKGGTLNLGYAAVVTATGNNVTATVGLSGGAQFTGNNTLVLTGSGDTVNYASTPNNEYVTLGGNGQFATGANIDVSNGVAQTMFVEFDSNVTFNSVPAGVTDNAGPILLDGNDAVTINTGSAVVEAFGGGDIVNLSSNGENSGNYYDVAFELYVPGTATQLPQTSQTSGVLNVAANSYVIENAANSTVSLLDHDNFSILGSGDTVNVTTNDIVSLGLLGGPALNTVNILSSTASTDDTISISYGTVNDLSPNYVTTGDVINVQNYDASSVTATLNVSHTIVNMANSGATINGLANIINENPVANPGAYSYSGNIATVGGNGDTALGGSLANATLVYLGDLDVLNVASNATVIAAVNSTDTVSAGHVAAVNLGANDYVSLSGTYAVSANAVTGSEVLVGFGGADTLALHSHFASSAELLSATSFSSGNAIIRADSADTLTLVGVGQATFSSDVASGLIKI